jgi:hypothetical protein
MYVSARWRLPGRQVWLARHGAAAFLVLGLPVPGGGRAKADDLEHHQEEERPRQC